MFSPGRAQLFVYLNSWLGRGLMYTVLVVYSAYLDRSEEIDKGWVDLKHTFYLHGTEPDCHFA